jgi:transcriptional regulator of acetoin/glycerol metabolism
MPAPVAAGGGFLSLEEVERRHLVAVLEACQGNVALAAQSMNMAKSTFYYRLSKHDIRPKELI